MHRTLETESPVSTAKPPGPSWTRRIRFGLRRNTLNFLCEIARDYGDASHFRVGHWDYWFFTHPDAVRDVLVSQDDQFIKGPALRRAKDTLGEGLLTSEGDLHRRQRRLVQPVLHPNRVASYAEVMVRYRRRDFGRLRRRAGVRPARADDEAHIADRRQDAV